MGIVHLVRTAQLTGEPRVSAAKFGGRGFLAVSVWICFALVMALGGQAEAQLANRPLPAPGFVNSAGFGVSYGEQLQRDAWFWGFSLDYGRRLGKMWGVNAALTWDREKKETGMSVETYSFVATVSWVISERFSLATGLAKGFADNENKEAKTQFTSGDLGTGLALGISLPELQFWAPETVALNLSVTYEYNISASETSVSMDLTMGISF